MATPSAAAISTSGASNTAVADNKKDKAAPVAKPERPDEETYKTELSTAEKALKAAEDRMVSLLWRWRESAYIGGLR